MIAVCLLGMPSGQVFAAENPPQEDAQQEEGKIPDVEPPVVKKVYTSYTSGMKAYKKGKKTYNLKKLLPKKIRRKYVVAQGAATDGKYVYQAFEKHKSHYCVILKYKAK